MKFWIKNKIFLKYIQSSFIQRIYYKSRLTRGEIIPLTSPMNKPDRESNKRWIYTSWTRFQKSSPGRDNTRRGGERNSGAAITPIKLSLRREKHRSINPAHPSTQRNVHPLLPFRTKGSPGKNPPIHLETSRERERGRGRISIQRRPLIIIEPVGVSLIPDKEGAARMRFGARTNPRGKYENREEETVDRYAFPPPRNPYWLSQRYWITIEGFVQEEIFY